VTKCPYCGGKINTSKELPRMSPREFKIFNLLLNKGRAYTKASEIAGGGVETTTRVAISNLNKKLKSFGLVITNYHGIGYRLEEA
jgi:DNA-binding response OmpR family regulator